MRISIEYPEKIRTKILDTAEVLFLENGVARTSLEMIARECGVTRGAMYWHFGDKSQLVIEMVDRVIAPLPTIFQNLDIDNEGDCLERLQDLCAEWMQKFAEPSHERRVMNIMLRRCAFTAELDKVKKHNILLRQEFTALTDSIFISQQHRLQAGVTPRTASVYLQSFLIGTLIYMFRYDDQFVKFSEVRVILAAYFKGLLKE